MEKLQQRGKQPQDALPGIQEPSLSDAAAVCNFLALGKQAFKIRFHLLHRFAVVKQHVVLKMMVKAPVIQIGGANGGHISVAEALLGMEEAGGIFKNPYSLVQ